MPTITPYIDAGQLLISILLGLVGVIGFLVRSQLAMIVKRIDNHDAQILGLLTTVSGLVAIVGLRTRQRKIDSIDGFEVTE